MGIANKFFKNTKGQFDINLAPYAILVLIVAAAFLVIGIIVLQGVFDSVEGKVDEGNDFYDELDDIKNRIISSILLAPLLIGVITPIFMLLIGVYLFFRWWLQ